MKIFTAILLGTLVALSFGNDSARLPDTTYVGNTVKVEVKSASKSTDDAVEQKRHDEILTEAKKTADATISMERATWLLAAFAFFGFLFGVKTFKETQKQSREELRAYVHVKVEDITGLNELNAWMSGRMSDDSNSVLITEKDGRFWAHNPPRSRYRVSVSNHGQTPAKKVTADITVAYDSWPFPTNPQITELPTIEQVRRIVDETRISNSLPPNQGDTFTITGDIPSEKWNISMPKKLRRLVSEPQAALYVYGYVGYFDVFDQFHVTHFRFTHITDKSDGLFSLAGIHMHPDGNDTT